jgi:hypothetical protein
MPGKVQPSFAAGEVSPDVYGRADIQKYHVAAEKMENFYSLTQGGAHFREGFQYVDEIAGANGYRFIEFTFSVVQTYMLVFTDLLLTVVRDGAVVATEVSPFVGADLAEIRYAQNADTVFLAHPDYQTRTLTRTSDTTWIFGTLDTTNTSFAPEIAQLSWIGSGTPTRTVQYRISAFKDSDVNDGLNLVQETLPSSSETVNVPSPWPDGGHVTIGWNPVLYQGVSEIIPEEEAWVRSVGGTNEYAACKTDKFLDTAGSSWTQSAAKPAEWYLVSGATTAPTIANIGVKQSGDYRFYTPGTVGSLAAGEWDWGDNDTLGADTLYIRLYDDSDPNSLGDNSVAEWLLENQNIVFGQDPIVDADVYEGNIPLTTGTKGSLAPGEYVFRDGSDDFTDVTPFPGSGFTGIYVRLLDTATANPNAKQAGYINYKPETELGYVVYKNYAGDWGFIGFTDNAWFVDDFITPDVTYGFKTGVDPFSTPDDYPGAVAFFQQRLWLARTNNNPAAAFASQTGTFSSFDVSDPVREDDAISAQLAVNKVNEIKHLLPVERLMAFTSDSEWAIDSGTTNTSAVTPLSINFRYQSSFGSGAVRPLVAANSVIFVDRIGDSQAFIGREHNHALESRRESPQHHLGGS